MLHLDASCIRQEIQCTRFFPWTTQPKHNEMGVIVPH